MLENNRSYLLTHRAAVIVHIGPGAFHRAHQALYTSELMRQTQSGGWSIIAASLFHGQDLAQNLKRQEGCFTVLEIAPDGSQQLKKVDAIRNMLAVKDNRTPLLDIMASQQTKIVSLTITEKGYCLHPVSLQLNLDDPLIIHDIENPHHPKTAMGLMVAALSQRRKNNITPFTILSCDNMIQNGTKTRLAVIQLAEQIDIELARWISNIVHFPSSVVDRIVPAMTSQSFFDVRRHLGRNDPCAVVTEKYRQWIIEDRFSMGRPDWNKIDGALFVDDATPYENLKLRLLNGSHSMLAYLGCLAGYPLISDAMDDPLILGVVEQYMFNEIIPLLDIPDGMNAKNYARSVLERFKNTALHHSTEQVAADGSQKLVQRWSDGLEDLLLAKKDFNAIALGIAAWIKYLEGLDDHNKTINVQDPKLSRFRRIISGCNNRSEVAGTMLQQSGVFPDSIAQSPFVMTRVHHYYHLLLTSGVRNTLATMQKSEPKQGIYP